MNKYLTIKDYIKSIILFIPMFFLISLLLTIIYEGITSDFIVIISFLLTAMFLYLRLLLISNTRKKEYQMMWQAKQDIMNNINDEYLK